MTGQYFADGVQGVGQVDEAVVGHDAQVRLTGMDTAGVFEVIAVALWEPSYLWPWRFSPLRGRSLLSYSDLAQPKGLAGIVRLWCGTGYFSVLVTSYVQLVPTGSNCTYEEQR